MKRCLLIIILIVSSIISLCQQDADQATLQERYVQGREMQGLYQDHDYYYYKQLYDESQSRQVLGIILTGIGIEIELAWLTTKLINDSSYHANFYSKDMTIVGLAYISFGLPLFISGAIRGANNRIAMDEIKLANKLSVGLKPDGIAITYRF